MKYFSLNGMRWKVNYLSKRVWIIPDRPNFLKPATPLNRGQEGEDSREREAQKQVVQS